MNITPKGCFVLAFALFALSNCGGGIESLVPDETLRRAQTWRIMSHYDYQAPPDERFVVTAEQRSLVERVKELAIPQIPLTHADTPTADIVVTLEQRQQSSGYGQVKGLRRREFIWWVRFFDRSGRKLGEFVERNQGLIQAANPTKLARKLAKDISAALTPTATR